MEEQFTTLPCSSSALKTDGEHILPEFQIQTFNDQIQTRSNPAKTNDVVMPKVPVLESQEALDEAIKKHAYVVICFSIKKAGAQQRKVLGTLSAKTFKESTGFYIVNYSQERDKIFRKHKIDEIPTFLIFKNGELHKSLQGKKNEKDIIGLLGEVIYVKDLTDADYQKAVSKGIVFIDFWAPWCGPCLKLAPHVKALAKELEGQVSFYKVNTDNHQTNYGTHGFRGIPALVIYKDGKVVDKFTGYRSKEKLMAKNQTPSRR